jgi:hypothetical protein
MLNVSRILDAKETKIYAQEDNEQEKHGAAFFGYY